ncbi:cysteine desulfurase family protein [Clostridium sediminicola]|uniref:cysteine desulfurase family protein n=1 Tax=Clostridium sediminicola TaxID=3114879 RepID=UPI0031F22537
MEVYFDNAATTKPYDEVINEVADVMRNYYGNPSSAHKLGIIAEQKMEQSRIEVSKVLNCSKDEIIFTSGGTESNNLLIKGFVGNNGHIITNDIEHPSVLNTFKELEKNNCSVTYIKVDRNGQIDLKTLEESITDKTTLLSIMHVNNEIGSVQDIETIGNILKKKSRRAKFHVDAVQSFGKYTIDVKKSKIDLLSASGHKIHGPRGVGIAYIKKGLIPKSIILGGGQERNFRAGTENLPGIAGFAKATEMIYKDLESNYQKVLNLKSYFIEKLSSIEDIKINSKLTDNFSPYILSVSFKGIRGEVLLHLLEEKNIFVSTGSACSSKNTKGSHVLKGIGIGRKEIEGTIRFSFNSKNTIEEVDYLYDILNNSLKFLRRV